MKIDKSLLKDTMGRPLTQGLFLEIGYNTDYAYYTLKNEDYDYQGNTYLSLKRLYLEHEDPVEYDFATTYLLGWEHWCRLCDNKVLAKHIQQWRYELELKLRSAAFKEILDMTADGNFQASKWLADKGWDKKSVGRPASKQKKIQEDLEESIKNDYGADVVRFKK